MPTNQVRVPNNIRIRTSSGLDATIFSVNVLTLAGLKYVLVQIQADVKTDRFQRWTRSEANTLIRSGVCLLRGRSPPTDQKQVDDENAGHSAGVRAAFKHSAGV